MPPDLLTGRQTSSGPDQMPITGKGACYSDFVTRMFYGAGFITYWFDRVGRLIRRRPAAPSPLPAPSPPADSAADPKPMSKSRLRALAAHSRPPQSWYEETANPFEPGKR
jgi:hypothetical protein